jgi:predicted kinase
MKRLYITRGLPGCGKSTWAKEFMCGFPAGACVRVNRDLIRENLHFSIWSKEAERLTVAVRNQMMRLAMEAGVQAVISDDTNLDPRVVGELTELAREYKYVVVFKDFTGIALDVCIDRDASRTGTARVGSKVILGMYDKYLKEAQNAVVQ